MQSEIHKTFVISCGTRGCQSCHYNNYM